MTTRAVTDRSGSTLWRQGHRTGVAGLPASQSDLDYARGHEAGRRHRKMILWSLANLVT